VGSAGTASAGQSQYIYLPTANGPMPIAAVINGATYALHGDHLNTPRRLSNARGQAVGQWAYSAFGEDKPTQDKSAEGVRPMNQSDIRLIRKYLDRQQ
jgi:hypothetical protein